MLLEIHVDGNCFENGGGVNSAREDGAFTLLCDFYNSTMSLYSLRKGGGLKNGNDLTGHLGPKVQSVDFMCGSLKRKGGQKAWI